MGAAAIATDSRTGLRRPVLTRHEVLVTGAIGAFAPQILRWYNQADFTLDFDAWAAVGHAGVVVLFLALAGYVTMLWGVRTLKEAFLVGLAVPSIILGPGGDLASLAAPRKADAQVRAVPSRTADARPPVGTIEVFVRAEDGSAITRFRTVATDGRSRTYSADNGYLPLPAGRYRLSVSAAGYEPDERRVVVAARQSAEINVTLHRLSPAQRIFNGAGRAVKGY
jgi:Carboxypeptidase regulatory-like domain